MLTEKTFEELLSLEGLSGYTESEKVKLCGALFDFSVEYHDLRGITKGFKISETIDQINLTAEDKINLHYYLANGWASQRRFNRFQNHLSWEYEQEELTQEILHLRKCIAFPEFHTITLESQCQILTNLGSLLNHIGRFVEAQETWLKALAIIQIFPMALGNRGTGLFYYANYIYDRSHQNIFIYHSYTSLKAALDLKEYLFPEAHKAFTDIHELIKSNYNLDYLEKQHEFNNFNLGKNKSLVKYRKWCLINTLYLNPLNDLAPYHIASHDCLNLPDLLVSIGEPPKFHSLFNQIKQEYATARFLFFEATCLLKKNYADKDVVIIDTFDYSDYSINAEKVKLSYRMLYSIFDKLAFLLNGYLKLDVKLTEIDFKSLWRDRNKKWALREPFTKSDNWALRGLYWLSKDLFNKDDNFISVIEPESKELSLIRNHIEHKSFKVVEYGGWGESIDDDFTFTIGRDKFERKTLKIMKLVRAAIIYTSLAIHYEEKRQRKPGIVIPFYLRELSFDEKI